MTRSKSKYKSTTAERNLDAFEFYMDFSDESITEEIYRNGLAHTWVFGVTEEALADGFELKDSDGNVLPIQDQLDSFFESTRYMQEIIQAFCYARAYGKAGVLHFQDGSIKGFKPKNMELDYDLKTREFKSIELTEYSIYGEDYIVHSSVPVGTDKGFNNKYFMYILFQEKDKTLDGKSVLESIWDYLQGLYICAYLSPLVVAQTLGVKIMRSPAFSAALNETQQASLLRPIRDMSHKLALGIGLNDNLEILYPPNNSFIEQTVDTLFSFLAATTGYPKEAWRGNQVGTTSGASQTENKILEIHKTIQKQATPYIKKSLKIISEITGIKLPDTFTVDWKFKQAMSEEQKNEQLTKQAAAVNGLGAVLTGNEIREILGKSKLEYFDDTLPLDQSQQGQNDIGINVTGLGMDMPVPGDNPNPNRIRNPNEVQIT